MSSRETKPLTLTISEQPSKLHRFRYAKETKDGSIGSVLHSQASEKLPVKVKITCGSSSMANCRLLLIGCALFDDLSMHPFYLVGDNCDPSFGVFAKEFELPTTAVIEIALDRIGIICTPKKRKMPSDKATKASDAEGNHQEAAYQTRLQKWNLFNVPPRKNPFQGKEVNQLRLGFQLFTVTQDQLGGCAWTPAQCNPVFTDLIADGKIYSKLVVDYVNPKVVTRYDQDVWLHTKYPVSREMPSNFGVAVELKNFTLPISELPVSKVKKHLIVFSLEAKREFFWGNVSVSVRLVDKGTGETSEPVQLQLDLPTDSYTEPATKRRRQGTNLATGQDSLEDLVAYFTEDTGI